MYGKAERGRREVPKVSQKSGGWTQKKEKKNIDYLSDKK